MRCCTTRTSTPSTSPNEPTARAGRSSESRTGPDESEESEMAGRGSGPDFVESLARGLDVLACFDAGHPSMKLSEGATAGGLARPTARRLLLTLEELGFARSVVWTFTLTPKVPTL